MNRDVHSVTIFTRREEQSIYEYPSGIEFMFSDEGSGLDYQNYTLGYTNTSAGATPHLFNVSTGNPLVGIYGSTSLTGFASLGLLQLDRQCQIDQVLKTEEQRKAENETMRLAAE